MRMGRLWRVGRAEEGAIGKRAGGKGMRRREMRDGEGR